MEPLLFPDDPSSEFEVQRTPGHAVHGGADVGEVLSTAQRIRAGDDDAWHDAWHDAWRATADRVAADPPHRRGRRAAPGVLRHRGGPVRPAARHRDGPVFRPDRETVVTPVLDRLLARPEVDHRLAACVARDGVLDLGATVTAHFPGTRAQTRALLEAATLLRLASAEGAGAHCQAGAQRLACARIDDWLDDVLADRGPLVGATTSREHA